VTASRERAARRTEEQIYRRVTANVDEQRLDLRGEGSNNSMSISCEGMLD